MKRIVCLLALLAVAAPVARPAPYVILKNGQRVEGSSIEAKSDGTIMLAIGTAPQVQLLQYPKGEYLYAEADKPAAIDAAVRALQGNQPDQAIPALKAIIEKYRYLGWDQKGTMLLARAHLMKKETRNAVMVFETLMRDHPALLETDPDAAWEYRAALLEDGQSARLKPLLEKAIQGGSGTDAARALMMRGEIQAKEGNTEGAMLDFLRTAMFYETERTVLPKAYFRAAEMLEARKDRRAKDWYRKVVEEFPGDPLAAKARPKL